MCAAARRVGSSSMLTRRDRPAHLRPVGWHGIMAWSAMTLVQHPSPEHRSDAGSAVRLQAAVDCAIHNTAEFLSGLSPITCEV